MSKPENTLEMATEDAKPHVLAVASAGGHWVQLTRLAPAWAGCNVTYLTTDSELSEQAKEISRAAGTGEFRFHKVTGANRWQKVRLLRSLFQIFFILLRIRPDVVITTGAAPGYFALRLAAVMGCRTIWIDSIANAEELSLAGHKAGKHCDLWLTQWEHLATQNGPYYRGKVI